MNIIDIGVEKGLINFDDDKSSITYIKINKKRNYNNPEEKVQALTYLKLIIEYGYNAEKIKMFVSVTMGSEKKEADIIVYNDDDLTQPHILVECKKEDVSEQEFLQAVEQAYSYAYALPNEVKYVWVTSGAKDEYFEVNKKRHTRETLPDIPQFGVKKLPTYKFAYDAYDLKDIKGEQKFFDLKVVDESVLTARFKQAHDSLWAGGQLNPSEAFDELDKLIFCKIWDERKDRRPGEPYDFQIMTIHKEEVKNWEKLSSDELRRAMREIENRQLFERVHNLYEEGRKKDAEVFRDNIRLTPEKIRTVVGYLQDINLSETDLDAKGRAFETFMGSFFRGNFGQYFTPRPIVKFAIEVLPIKNTSYVLDTSCGSGGFLLYALNKVRQEATKIYPNYKKDTKQFDRWKRYWHDFAENNLFGIEINEQISRAAKMNMIIHDDGHTNVITSDGLLHPNDIEKITKNTGFKYNHFDFIITNPPFGSIVKQTEKAYLKEYKLGKKEEDWLAIAQKPETERGNQNTEILFIEQCYNFLKEGGYLAIVIPDGILTNSSLQYVRDHIEEIFRIVAVVSIPQTAFMANGAGVKSSVLFLKKYDDKTTQKFQSIKSKSKNKVKETNDYIKEVSKLEKAKKESIKELEKSHLKQNPKLTKNELAELIKSEKIEIQQKFTEELNELKDKLSEEYTLTKQKELPDYPIFMAIAENIGYDATGKSTGEGDGDLDIIKIELAKFINQIENNEV